MAFPIMALMAIGQSLQEMGDANAQAIVDKYEATQAQEAGEAIATEVRRQGAFAIGSAVRNLAASGVSSTSGTGALILQDIKRRSEADAMAAVLSGKSRARALQFMAQQRKNQAQASLGASVGSFAMQGGFGGKAVAKDEGKKSTTKIGSYFASAFPEGY